MISIVICSSSNSRFQDITNSIKKTIDETYEIIRINNEDGIYSICEAYNKGALLSRFPYLCFVHEDVIFKTSGWGQNLVKHFINNKNAGLIGVAGSVYKTKMSSGWWQSELINAESKRIQIIQYYKSGSLAKEITVNPNNNILEEVIVVDGVFLATTKHVWSENKFDEQLLAGFHGYDLDFSIQIGRKKKIYVAYDILLEHYSEGNCDIDWFKDNLKVHRKWRYRLPLKTHDFIVEDETAYTNAWKRLRKNINFLFKANYGFFNIVRSYYWLSGLIDSKPSFLKFYRHCIHEGVKICFTHYSLKNAEASRDE